MSPIQAVTSPSLSRCHELVWESVGRREHVIPRPCRVVVPHAFLGETFLYALCVPAFRPRGVRGAHLVRAAVAKAIGAGLVVRSDLAHIGVRVRVPEPLAPRHTGEGKTVSRQSSVSGWLSSTCMTNTLHFVSFYDMQVMSQTETRYNEKWEDGRKPVSDEHGLKTFRQRHSVVFL